MNLGNRTTRLISLLTLPPPLPLFCPVQYSARRQWECWPCLVTLASPIALRAAIDTPGAPQPAPSKADNTKVNKQPGLAADQQSQNA